MPIKQQFPIYEFSKKFDYIQNKNGIWVSGGYVLNQKKAFERSNYKNGDINEIPNEIRQAIIGGLFEIPDAYPTNSLTDQEFIKLVETGKLDIAHPPLEHIALIARNLIDYCILAVATRQIDDKWRTKLIGYRFFWLKIADLGSQSLDLVDEIATLLSWWMNNKLCFDMNPTSYESRDYLGETIICKYDIIESYKRERKILESSPYPYLFEGTIDRPLNCFELHAQAVHLSNLHTAWAWNIRKLKKPETFTVVYCADRISYKQFFSLALEPINDSPQQAKIGGNYSSQNQYHQPNHSSSDSLTAQSPVSRQDTFKLQKSFEYLASNTESQHLESLIEFYQTNPPSKSRELWFNGINQEVGENHSQKLYQADINYLMLLNVFLGDVLSQGNSGKQNKNFSEEHKQWAIKYMDELSCSIGKYENKYKKPVSQLKQNIVKLRENLLGKDRSKGEHSNWLHSKLNLFIDIVARRHYKNYSLPIVLILLVLLYPLITSALEKQDKLELQALELQKLEQQLNDKRLAWQKLEEQHTGELQKLEEKLNKQHTGELQKLQNEGKIKQSETKVRIRGCIQNKRNQTRQDFLKCVK